MPEIILSVDSSSVQELLANVQGNLRRKVLFDGVRAVARSSRKQLRSVTPRRTGRTRALIKDPRVRQSGGVFEARIRRPRIFNLLEPGAKPHVIVPRRKAALFFGGRFASQAEHPGFPGRVLWQPVVAATALEAPRVFREKIAQVLARARARGR